MLSLYMYILSVLFKQVEVVAEKFFMNNLKDFTLYGQSLSNFITFAANDIKMLISVVNILA
jgi:hypothetical protein